MHVASLVALLFFASACGGPRDEAGSAGRIRIVFKHQPLWGDPAALRGLLARFAAENPDVEVATEVLPNASEVLHQYLLTTLEAGSQTLDLFVADVVWVPELARAGWIADLSEALPPAELRRDFLPGPAEAVIVDGRTWAVPWYVDVGLLFYRTDLVPRAPRTYGELEEQIRAALRQAAAEHRGLAGYVWQGRQYEGLVCNGYEAAWGHGAPPSVDGRLGLEDPELAAGLGWLRSLLERGLSPPSVTSAAEEEARRIFQEGGAVFMRNWPYAWAEAQREGSPVRGRVGYAALPTLTGEPGWGALGGWQLVVNARVSAEKRAASTRLAHFLASPEASVALALANARNPARRAPYRDERLRHGAPFIAGLLPIVERARPRPVTPYYVLVSDVLQGEFSAVVAGIRAPDRALRRARRLVDHVAGGEAP